MTNLLALAGLMIGRPAPELYIQGDVCFEKVADCDLGDAAPVEPDEDGMVVVARGEATGHRHGFFGGATMFHDEALARDACPPELYLGHVKVTEDTAVLVHDDSQSMEPSNHAPISLAAGTYLARGQRQQLPSVDLDDPADLQIARVID